jgi:hypothetical protein
VSSLPDPGHVRLIAVTETRRRIRALTDQPTRLVAMAVAGLFLLLPLAAVTAGAFFAGRNPNRALVGTVVTVAPAGLWLLAAVFLGLRVLTDSSDPDNLDGYLTTVPARELFAGVATVEALGTLLYLGLPTLLAATGFAVGSGSLLALATVTVTGLAATGLGLATGLAVGFGVKNVAVRSRLVARLRVPTWTAVFLAYVWTFLSGEAESVFDPLLRTVARPPLTWLGELALAPVVGPRVPTRGLIALALTVGTTGVLLAVAAALARLLWYADGVETDNGAVGDRQTQVTPGALGRVVGRQTAWVARVSTTRARRAPLKLLFVAYPVFLLAPSVTEAVETGTIPASLPAVSALYAAWAGGAGFALNPLGDQGATLPVAVTTGVSGTAFVRGVVLPGVALGGGTATLLAGGLAAAGGAAPARAVLLGLAGATLGGGAPALAAGFGVLFPKYETSQVTRSREAVVPSLFAFAGYSLVLVVLAGPGLALAVPPLTGVVGDLLGVAPLVVSAAGVTVSLFLVAVGGWLSFRYAARSFERFTVE